jgi:hypothetical protein
MEINFEKTLTPNSTVLRLVNFHQLTPTTAASATYKTPSEDNTCREAKFAASTKKLSNEIAPI